MVYCEKCMMDVPSAYHWREKYKHSKVCCRCVSEIDLPCISKYQRDIINIYNQCSSSYENVSSSEIYVSCKKISENSVNGRFFFKKYMEKLSIEKLDYLTEIDYDELVEYTWFLANNTPPFLYIVNLQESEMIDTFEKMSVNQKNVHFNLL